MKARFDKSPMREALREAVPDTDQASAEPASAPGFSYVPQSHALALDPDISIVSGIRGAGKSYWWAILRSPPHLAYLAKAFPEVASIGGADITHGFGAGSGESYPNAETVRRLVAKIDARYVWRAVIATNLRFPPPFPEEGARWEVKASWVRDHPELYDSGLALKDRELANTGRRALILFDALDRLAADWPKIRKIAAALFEVALEIRSQRYIRLKLFARPDMLEDEAIVRFPDASKLLSKKLDLAWRRVDPYALLFQRLGNATRTGEWFREHTRREYGLSWQDVPASGAWVLPKELRYDEGLQKDLFHAIAGPTMARGESGHKRGLPYTWLVNHLMDGREQVSPRSLFAALREAAQGDHDEEWGYALDPRSVQRGVTKASEIRKNEVVEDYPWVSTVMEPLGEHRLVIPCEEAEITRIWAEEQTISKLGKRSRVPEAKLPPRHLAEGPRGIIDDLKELGVAQRLSDRRVQIPDVYRIAFGLGRIGGVKPLK